MTTALWVPYAPVYARGWDRCARHRRGHCSLGRRVRRRDRCRESDPPEEWLPVSPPPPRSFASSARSGPVAAMAPLVPPPRPPNVGRLHRAIQPSLRGRFGDGHPLGYLIERLEAGVHPLCWRRERASETLSGVASRAASGMRPGDGAGRLRKPATDGVEAIRVAGGEVCQRHVHVLNAK